MLNPITYDAECSFCNSVVRFLRKRDRRSRFRFVPLQSEEGGALLKEAGLETGDRNTVVYYSGKKIYLRSTAVLNILKDTGTVWSILYIFIIFPRFLRDFIYRTIARYRYDFAGKVNPRSD